ncbi:MAG: DOMON-like domain-containing protein [Candidatus Sericytochromatia bacterium]|nr:DOMON-like domain-containing protein [Candidatus Tanganyikabacteria bacterium]
MSGAWQLLVPWPDAAVPDRVLVAARVRREGAVLVLGWKVEDVRGCVSVPEAAPIGARRDGLWEATCFEAFLAGENGPGYLEINVAPSGDWQCYGFSGYREGRLVLPEATAPELRLVRTTASLELEARFSAGLEALGPQPWRVGLTAVIEDRAGSLSYWALAHTGPEPDFHRADSWSSAV